MCCWTSRSPAETRALARALGAAFDGRGGVVGLVGPLGAGKTEFAKGLAEGLGLDPMLLASPTFVIAGELPVPEGRALERLVHADFYRVADPRELEMAGLADWLAPGTLLLAEWADRFPRDLPADRLDVTIERAVGRDPLERTIRARPVAGPGSAAERVLGRWRNTCP